MVNKLSDKALSLYVKAQVAISRVRERFDRAYRHAREGTAFESGQGFTEYIVIIAGVLLIGSAIFVMFRTIRSKYQSANSAIGSLPVQGGW
jgi:hypothetical protein